MNTTIAKPQLSEEISLKELIQKIKEWIAFLKTKWIFIVLVGVIGGGLGFVYAWNQKTKYTATLTFALEEEKSGAMGLSGALGIANSLGFDIGAGAGGAFSGSNLIELMKSRTLVEKALLNPISVKGKAQTLAEYYIAFTQMNKGWLERQELKNIKFNLSADRSRFTILQDSVLGVLYQQITGEGGVLSVFQKDKKISIITIEVKSKDEMFSKYFAETIAKVVSDFYIETKSKKARLNYEILQKQTDSVRNELNSAITGVAVANDNTYNLNPALNIHRSPSMRRQVDVQANTAILTQLVTNLEIAKVSLRKETPLIQIIDAPILPLKKEGLSKSKALVIGAIMGVIISIFFLVISQFWKKLM